jgi:predicted DNA binding CopG/RHH family protein
MKKNNGYTAAPADIAQEMKSLIQVADFLPSPETITVMLKKEPTVPVTMNLKKKTVESYRKFAKRNGIKYQVFISTVLDNYAKSICL